jgi:hypothetical protein
MQDATESASEEVDAAQAFEELRAEVSVLRRAVEGLPEEWEANQPPDYTTSLGAIAKGLAGVVGRLDGIERHPALRMTPEQHQQAIAQAGNALMREATSNLYQATKAAERERDELAGVIGSVRGQRQQMKWLAITAAAALILGLLIAPFAARVLPFGWNGGVAASILHTDRWNAGIALMKSANPEGWTTLVNEMNLVEPNHAVLSACREAAARVKKPQPCTIVVPAP